MTKYFPYIEEWKLIPSKGGMFEVKVDDELVFSKNELDRFPRSGEIADIFSKRFIS